MSTIIPVTKLNKSVVTLLQGGVSRGLNEVRVKLIGEVLRNEYGVRPVQVEVICFDSGQRENKYICDKMYNLHQLRGTVVGVRW